MNTLLDMIKAMLIIFVGAVCLAIFESVCLLVTWIQGCIKRARKGHVKEAPHDEDYKTASFANLNAYIQNDITPRAWFKEAYRLAALHPVESGFAAWQKLWEQEQERER